MILPRGVGYPGAIDPRVDELVLRQIQIARDDNRILVPVQYHFVYIMSP